MAKKPTIDFKPAFFDDPNMLADFKNNLLSQDFEASSGYCLFFGDRVIRLGYSDKFFYSKPGYLTKNLCDFLMKKFRDIKYDKSQQDRDYVKNMPQNLKDYLYDMLPKDANGAPRQYLGSRDMREFVRVMAQQLLDEKVFEIKEVK